MSGEDDDSSTNPYLPPESELIEDQESTFEGVEAASRWQRLFAYLIDSLFQLVIGIFITYAVILGIRSDADINWYQVIDTGVVYFWLLIGGVFVLANFHLLQSQGQTIGKYLTKTRIVKYKDNKILNLRKILILRFVPILYLSLIPIIGVPLSLINCLMIFRADKRCLHDHIAGTKVIKVVVDF